MSNDSVPLQVVRIDTNSNSVMVIDESLSIIERNLEKANVDKISIVSVMGAYRTGKSFLLDIFLRFLRHEDNHSRLPPVGPARDSGLKYPLPEWLISKGEKLAEGMEDNDTNGFRWRPGMEKCTEGIWIWSKPFIRTTQRNEKVAVLLMDTQGAWDNRMTKEQSATIFGLTAVLASKQIYNISKQIQEDKIENLRYFMEFASAAIRITGDETCAEPTDDQKAFQCLEFLVRDWPNFEDEWTSKQCQLQMNAHLAQHLDPANVRENETITALNNMFASISCWCLPHPGLQIEKKSWSGKLDEVDNDFIRFMDLYVRKVFDEQLVAKKILGEYLSPKTFSPVLRCFVEAFKDAAPAATSFSSAMAQSTSLLAKDSVLKRYTEEMDAFCKKGNGLHPDKVNQQHSLVKKDVMELFKKKAVFGSSEGISEIQAEIETELAKKLARYLHDNERMLEQALVASTTVALVGVVAFVIDKFTDYTCDWWSQTCRDVSQLLLTVYLAIFVFLGYNVYVLFRERGRMAAMLASMELGKSCLVAGEKYSMQCRENIRDPQKLKAFALNCVESVRSAATAMHKVATSSNAKNTAKFAPPTRTPVKKTN